VGAKHFVYQLIQRHLVCVREGIHNQSHNVFDNTIRIDGMHYIGCCSFGHTVMIGSEGHIGLMKRIAHGVDGPIVKFLDALFHCSDVEITETVEGSVNGVLRPVSANNAGIISRLARC